MTAMSLTLRSLARFLDRLAMARAAPRRRRAWTRPADGQAGQSAGRREVEIAAKLPLSHSVEAELAFLRARRPRPRRR